MRKTAAESKTFEEQVLAELAGIRSAVADLDAHVTRLELAANTAVASFVTHVQQIRSQLAGSSLAKMLGLRSHEGSSGG